MKMKVRNFVAYLLVLMLISTDIAAVAEAAMKTLTLPAALKVIDAVGGLQSMSMIDHTLLLEYRLGYINSYEQVERELERKKKTA